MLTRRWKLILAITFIIWMLSIYSAVQFTNEIIPSASNASENERKWVVQPGDIIEFEAFINSNSSAHTLVDKIVSEYKYKECEKDVWGNRIIRVRAKDAPTEINITLIAEQIINLSGPVQVEQEINEMWELKENITLPFFIPIGFWDNLSVEFKRILPADAIVEYTYSWVGEYEYTLRWNSSGFCYYVWHVWEEKDGVLQATVINVTSSDGKTDSFEIHLSSQKMSYENEETQINYAELQKAGTLLLMFIGIISFPAVGGYTLRKIRELKKKEKEGTEIYYENKYREISSTLLRWDEIKRTYILLWFGVNIFSLILGFETFTFLINISETATSEVPIITTIIIGLLIGAAFVVLLYYYMARLMKYSSKRTTHTFTSESAPLISFMLGFAHFLFGSIIWRSFTIPTITGRLIMLGLFALLIFTISIAYFVMRPWKDLSFIRKTLEEELEQLTKRKK
mgnify:CR=1 FL=1